MALIVSAPVGATTLTFEVFDSNLNVPPYNDPGVQPVLPGFGYTELFPIPTNYGDNVSGAPGTIQVANPLNSDQVFRYLIGSEGGTPNVTASYGPFSIFTGGPNLWREGYGDLNGILFQASRGTVGFDYDVLDVVLVADAGFDVVLHEFQLGSFLEERTINSISLFSGVPFPFLTPTNFLGTPLTSVAVSGAGGHSTFTGASFGLAADVQAPVIWLRIDASNLGEASELIGIDNIRFSQVESDNPSTLDPSVIDRAFQSAEAVPGPAPLGLLVGGLGVAALVRSLRRRR